MTAARQAARTSARGARRPWCAVPLPAAPWSPVAAVTVAACLLVACGSPAAAPVRRVAPTTTPSTAAAAPTTTLPSAEPTTIPTPVVASPGWSRPATALPPAGGFTAVSCISDVFCLAAGGGANQADAADSAGSGAVAAWDGATWGQATTYFASTGTTGAPPWMPAISCTDGPLCAVVDGSGHTSLGDGTTWSPPAPLAPVPGPAADPADPGPGTAGSRTAAVSCPTSQFCAYVDNTGHVATLHGTVWSAPQVLTRPLGASAVALFQSGRVGVSCASATACTALVGGASLDWDGSGWTETAGPWAAADSGDTAVSCPAPGTCTAVHGTAVATRSPGAGWSQPRTVDPAGRLDAVSCPSLAVCVAADADGDVLRSSGGSWGPPQKVVPSPTAYTGDGASLSCTSEQFCLVLTGDGDFATYQGGDTGASAATVPATTVPTGT